MTKGRIPFKALEKAEPIAANRGEIQHYVREPGTICNFEILSPGIVAKVAVRCIRRLCCTVSEIERECAEKIAELRIIASSKEISRELWLCSPRYAYRFFRVLDKSIVELGRDGLPLPSGDPGPAPAERPTPMLPGKPTDSCEEKLGDSPVAETPGTPVIAAPGMPDTGLPEKNGSRPE